MESSDSHSDQNIKHFQSRSQRPNIWARIDIYQSANSPDQEQNLGGSVDDTRFKYIGTSQKPSAENMTSAKVTRQYFAAS